ncbi:hypothetical protein [Fodinicola acaciae]|uniref:hypothetical protein n=1 Tax=Fodinicola acaciae TaxID=2681555 RepID=UPI0013D4E1C9|nr:hypothetical protein [Fodinicola acaciae]
MKSDDGSTVVEFVFLAVVILIPLIYVVLVASALQRNAFGVTEAARQAGRAYATAGDETSARSRAAYAMRLALEDQGLSTDATQLRFVAAGNDCQGPETTPSLAPGSAFAVCVVRAFRLPAVPSFVDGGHNTVTGVFVVRIDRFRGA